MWRVIPGQLLVYRCWDDEAVLYNDLSGATHLLGPAALCLLQALRAGPLDEAALGAVLLEEFEIGDACADPAALADELADDLTELLGDLVRLDLVEPMPC
ncbi:HPr-rel-A system PqqD family peptide chaperone [Massilia sp. H6]|uniref:HPr-rel-A system PqqD family peptide chaperone n=1 Tax=Massilia sp. H6 TaxID=2970464 RepID=UPI002169E05B|nr:HPr-rel-A system PqqD family peptide chaperone [Massilia sp. H6]UVW28908.1 HPr-rel-A system PqqD family peptide chaperone [Massilia sp. H6]